MSELPEKDQSSRLLLDEPEPWEAWESKLVGICLLIAIIGLVVLGWLIHTFILD